MMMMLMMMMMMMMVMMSRRVSVPRYGMRSTSRVQGKKR